MLTIRERLEQIEAQTLRPYAQYASRSAGRVRPEEPDGMRTAYQRDRDRILHSKAFRRLSGKTQVFLAPQGDHYRTRITHTLEVSQVARTIALALGLNQTLVEAIVMGHDLGHTPFGHAGEKVLAHLLPGGFHHVKQSLRVVDVLEHDGAGLNLTQEVRDGILKHSKGKGAVLSENPNLRAMTLEGQVVRLADIIAYVNHDLDDAMRAGLLRPQDVPPELLEALGRTHSALLAHLVEDVVTASEAAIAKGRLCIDMSPAVYQGLLGLRDFLYLRVYETPRVRGEFDKAQGVLEALYHHLHEREDEFRAKFWPRGVPDTEDFARAIGDFLSGMTDRYAMRFHQERLMPRSWPLA